MRGLSDYLLSSAVTSLETKRAQSTGIQAPEPGSQTGSAVPQLCDLEQVTCPPCTSITPSVERGWRQHHLRWHPISFLKLRHNSHNIPFQSRQSLSVVSSPCWAVITATPSGTFLISPERNPPHGLHVFSRLSCVWLFATPWTVARQAPLSIAFSKQEYWTGLPFSPPGDLPNPGIEPATPVSPALQADSYPTEPPFLKPLPHPLTPTNPPSVSLDLPFRDISYKRNLKIGGPLWKWHTLKEALTLQKQNNRILPTSLRKTMWRQPHFLVVTSSQWSAGRRRSLMWAFEMA